MSQQYPTNPYIRCQSLWCAAAVCSATCSPGIRSGFVVHSSSGTIRSDSWFVLPATATGCVWKSTAVLPCSSAPDHERDCRSTAAVIFPAVLPPAILFATATFVLSVLSLRRAMDRPPALLSHPRRMHRPLQTMARIRISRRGSGTRLPLVCGWPRRS
jgi:hypothetical protein